MNMGQTIVDNMKKTAKSEEEPAVKWVEVKNKEGVVYKTSLPKIKFDKSSLAIIDDNWWEN